MRSLHRDTGRARKWVALSALAVVAAGLPGGFGGRTASARVRGLTDVESPVVRSVTVTPNSLSNDTSSDVIIDVLVATETDTAQVELWLRTPSHPSPRSAPSLSSLGLVEGTPRNGTYRFVAHFMMWSDPGEYGFRDIGVRDTDGNLLQYSEGELLSAGVPVGTIDVSGPRDDDPPSVLYVDFEPDIVLTDNDAPPVTIEIGFEDQVGLDGLKVILIQAGTGLVRELVDVHVYPGFPFESGDAHSGVYSLTFPVGLLEGEWVPRVVVDDVLYNRRTYDLTSGIPMETLTVVTLAARPFAPVDASAVPGDHGEIVVSWSPPEYWRDASPPQYLVEARLADKSVINDSGAPSYPWGSAVTPDPDIIGGQPSSIYTSPWQGALIDADELDAGVGHFCGASLVAPRVAVTAAHCVVSKSVNDFFVAFGQSTLSDIGVLDRVPVSHISVHPSYDPVNLTNDLALLLLRGTPSGGWPIRVLRESTLPTEGTMGEATGWGVFAWDSEYYYLPDQLRASTLRVQSGPDSPTCGDWGDTYNSSIHLCAGLHQTGTCYGDSGGPLAYPYPSEWRPVGNYTEWTLLGVTSFGPRPELGDCGAQEYPSVFTRVSSYEGWFDGHFTDPFAWAAITTAETSVVLPGLEPDYRYEIRVSTIEGSSTHSAEGIVGRASGSARFFPWPARLAGTNRYGTAASIANAVFPDPVDVVLVATGSNFPDGLAGSAVAGRLQAPLLLVSATSVPPATAAELERLDPDVILILGGTGVISEDVESALQTYGPTVRLAGRNRYETAVAISRYGFPVDGSADQVVVATGLNFPDALAGGPAAAALGGPVLLTSPLDLPDAVAEEIRRLQPERIVVLGGTGVVSGLVFEQLQLLAPEVIRVAGSNRYSTAVQVNQLAFDSEATAYVATGLNFPDALAGAAAAAAQGVPLYLVAGAMVPGGVTQNMQLLGVEEVVLIGGSAVVGDQVRIAMGVIFGPQ